MKDIQYLTHDLGARNDPKLMDLQMDMGGKGLGIFWCLVELLWENGGYIPANYKSIAFALRWCTAGEVEKVVTNYGLFQVEEGMITSRSALARISEKRAKFEKRSNAGRIGAEGRWNNDANGKGITNAKQSQCDANAVALPLTNILTNLHTNIDNNNNIPPTADFVFEIFFFRNMKDPEGEAKRFFKHYIERHWAYQDGTPITDIEKAILDWKPAKAGDRFPADALNWYRAVWNAAKGRLETAFTIFLWHFKGMRLNENRLALIYENEIAARSAASFIQENDLGGDWIIDYRVSN